MCICMWIRINGESVSWRSFIAIILEIDREVGATFCAFA